MLLQNPVAYFQKMLYHSSWPLSFPFVSVGTNILDFSMAFFYPILRTLLYTIKYSQQELFESNEYKTISALVLKIEDDISHWGKSLSIKDRAIYNTNRDLLEERLNDVERQIRSRTPTNWEKLKNFFSKFIDFVLEHLPKIWNGLRIAAKQSGTSKDWSGLAKGLTQ